MAIGATTDAFCGSRCIRRNTLRVDGVHRARRVDRRGNRLREQAGIRGIELKLLGWPYEQTAPPLRHCHEEAASENQCSYCPMLHGWILRYMEQHIKAERLGFHHHPPAPDKAQFAVRVQEFMQTASPFRSI